MSRYFVTDAPVPVYEFDASEVISDTPPNVIYIKAKMDVATDARVKSELLKLGSDNKTMESHLGENAVALLIHNIVKWEGPDFIDAQGRPIPCDAAHIRTLDPNEPHIALVLEEITRRNARVEGPSPKSRAASTLESAGAADSTPIARAAGDSLSLQLATGRSPLSSHINSIGYQKKSEDSTPIS
jgi:hypothetical protein